MSFDDIKLRLQNPSLSSLIGLAEDLWFDAKQENYDLASASAQYELAKDVSSFANSEGGFLVVGLETDQDQNENIERVSRLNLFARESFNISRYEGMIVEYVYPAIKSLSVYWQANSVDPSLGIGIIEIPPQTQLQHPYLICKIVHDGVRQKEIVFGYSKRTDASNDPAKRDRIYQSMKAGMHPDLERMTRIEAKIDSLEARLSPVSRQETPAQRLSERIQDLLESSE
jgi:hypothetical protein